MSKSNQAPKGQINRSVITNTQRLIKEILIKPWK